MKTLLMLSGAAAAGAIAALAMAANSTQAADEVRCRVNAEALIRDLAALSRPVDADEIKRLLQPKP